MAVRPFNFELKSIDDKTGVFTGYGSVFGNMDSYGDIVARGAFAESLKESERKGQKIPLLWQHDVSAPIGVCTSLKEDNHGLKVIGRLALEVAKAREARDLMTLGALTGISIGFITKEAGLTKVGRRLLKKIQLWEISLVTFPANESARVLSVNSSDIQTIRDYESLLTDVGFPRSRAKMLARAWITPNAKAGEGSRAIAKELADGLRAYAKKIEKSQEIKDAKHQRNNPAE